jgi:biopolymer transport protein ExbD
MHRKVKKAKLKEDISPNVVPMIDIMFLLLLFFMLGADMSQREAIEISIPRAKNVPEPIDVEAKDKVTVTVNIHHATPSGAPCPLNDNNGICREEDHWQWQIMGVDYPREEMKKQLVVIAQDNLEPVADTAAGVKLSALFLLIRADEKAPYGDVQKLTEYAGLAKIYKIQLAANKPLPGEK